MSATLPAAPSLLFAFRGRDLLVRIPGGSGAAPPAAVWTPLAVRAHLPSPGDEAALGLALAEGLAVGEVGGKPCRAVALPDDWRPPAGFEVHGLRRLWGALPEEHWRMAGRAVQLLDWDRNHRFCGRCATPTERAAGEWARACPACGLEHFPRLSPAVIVRIDHGDRMLLARSPHFAPGVYSTLAGFVEPGESLEETVVREVFEEVGVRVGNVRYFGSQPWPFPNSLMIGFVADYESGEIRCQPGEIEDAAFFSREALPGLPAGLSIARALIDDFLCRG